MAQRTKLIVDATRGEIRDHIARARRAMAYLEKREKRGHGSWALTLTWGVLFGRIANMQRELARREAARQRAAFGA